MHNFCTLFDSSYLSRGLTMYNSLKQHSSDFHLYIFPFDELSLKILSGLNLENVTLVSLANFETPELLKTKQSRTKAEYCWTCTSSTIAYVLDNFKVPDCTYIDADLFFFNSPEVLLNDLNLEKTVLITGHRYSFFSKLYEEKRAGKFCVQFITFKNNPESRLILDKWISQCIEWCYARFEQGKFGDQKYLDSWPDIYNNVMVSEHLGAGVAPWNVNQFLIKRKDDYLSGVEKKTGKDFELIFYHFHFVRFMDNGSIDLGWNRIPKDIQSKIYIPYIISLKETELFIERSFSEYKTKYYKSKSSGLKETIKHLIKKVTKFNLIEI